MLLTVWAFLASAAAGLAGCGSAPPKHEGTDIVQALSGGGDTACYEKADRPRPLQFPEDFGPHPGFRTEWWYYTGNLEAPSGREFGFQLTFFRQALDCERPDGPSAWRTNQLWFAHFAITDVENRSFYAAQRMNRGALGLAGAESLPFRAWIDDWSSEADGPGSMAGPLRLRARDRGMAKGGTVEKDFALDLSLTRTKPLIRQGREGWSHKGSGPGDASYYYSFPGMTARGQVVLGDETFRVTGHAWFDHEWSTSALGTSARGWDWFALHLSSGPHAGLDLMVCQVRQASGEPVHLGSLSLGDGTVLILGQDQFSITPLARWTSPVSGKTYPSRWRIQIPDRGLDLEVETVVPDQEHGGGLIYYEGAVRVSEPAGSQGSGASSLWGRGYVEMTGY